MGRRVAASAILLLLSALALLSPAPASLAPGPQDLVFTIRMSATYSNRGAETWNLTEGDRTVELFLNTTWQEVRLVNQTLPVEATKTDEDGNPGAVLRFPTPELRPNEIVSFNVTYQAVSRPRLIQGVEEGASGNLSQIPEELRGEFCGAGEAWLVDDPELRALAWGLAGNEARVLTLVLRFVGWIKGNIKYPFQLSEVPQYPNETYLWRQGDCDDQAILLITLCRICGIPAHLQLGCIYVQETTWDTYWGGHLTYTLRRIAWHGWTVVYVPPWGWLPVDLTYVWGGLRQPLDAITGAAVTSQLVVQDANVTRTAYVAPAREERAFLQENGLYVSAEYEMILENPEALDQGRFGPLTVGMAVTAAVVVAVVSVILVHDRIRVRRP